MNIKKVFLITATIAVILTVILAAGCTSTQEQTVNTAISSSPVNNDNFVTKAEFTNAVNELKALINDLKSQTATESSVSALDGLTFDKSDYGKVLKVDSNGKLTLGRDATGSGGSTTYVDAKWGGIKGTLSEQEDLVTELNKRLDMSEFTSEDNSKFLVVDIASNGGGAKAVDTIPASKVVAEEGKKMDPEALPIAEDGKAGIVIPDGTTITVDSTGKISATGTSSVSFESITGEPSDNTKLATALAGKVNTVEGKGLSTNDYTTDEKNKLSSAYFSGQTGLIASKYLGTDGDGKLGLVNGPSTTWGNITGTLSNQTDLQGVLDAKQTTANLVTSLTGTDDTKYPSEKAVYTALQGKAGTDEATTSTNGLMSSTDKTKLDGIASGAEVNKIESIKVNGTAQSISDKSVDLAIPNYTAGTNIQIADSVISATDTKYTAGTNISIDANNTISATGEANVLEGVQLNGTDLSITNKKVNIVNATTGSSGLMSSDDKNTLDGISSTYATKTELAAKQDALTFDDAPTQSSTNPVKSSGIYTALGTKADSSSVYTKTESDTALAGKQDKLTAGTNILIDANNTISATGEANVLEGVQLNGTDLSITNKKVNIVNATTGSSGLMSSDDKNTLDGISSTYATKTELAAKQDTISSTNKISADNVENGTTNKFNVQADWDQTTTTADDYIKNKPTIVSDVKIDGGSSLVTTGTATIPKASSSNLGVVKVDGTTITADENGVITANAGTPAAHATSHITGGSDAIQLATTSQDGLLSSTDWNSFDGKQDAISGTDGNVVTYTSTSGTLGEKSIDSTVTKDSTNLVTSGAVSSAVDAVFDTIYPVGSIYMSVGDTLPNSFKGTWEKISDGTFLMSANGTTAVGSTGGEKTHTLTTAEMPTHNHTFTGTSATTSSDGNHTHTRGTMEIEGAINTVRASTYFGGTSVSGAFYKSAEKTNVYCLGRENSTSDGNYSILFKASKNWSGNTSENGAHTHTVTATGTIGDNGSGQAHNNLPPYLAVSMWKRTA